MKGREIATTTIDTFVPRRPRPGEYHVALRNLQAIQGALLRGDEHVTLFEWPSIPPGIWDHVQRAEDTIGEEEVNPFTVFPSRNAPCDPWFSQDARNNIENKRWYGMKFKFIKVLAQGGHGYATLWNVVYDDKSVRKVVIKRAIDPLTNAFDPRKEAEFHLRYDGAQHTTQVIDLHREATAIHNRMKAKSTYSSASIRHGQHWNAEEQKCVVFEYMQFGDMVSVMQTVAAKKVQIPDQVLWGIWECLVLGLATIAYTPSINSGDSSFEMWWKRFAESDAALDFLDTIETGWQIEHDVHLDLEVFNVLAGHDPATHPYQPIFKLHDLGAWSFKMNKAWESQNETEIWSMRGPVKLHGMAPEQFSKEWDTMPVSMVESSLRRRYGGEDLTKGNRVAGRFGVWTNIFLVARVMESIMTGVFSKFPYQTVAHYDTQIETYGGMLQTPEFDHIDPSLRDVVARCLYEEPQYRPPITEILAHIRERKRRLRFNDPPEFVTNWWKALFEPQEPMPLPSQIPPPASPVKQAVVASATKGGVAIASHMAQAAGNQGAGNQGAPNHPPSRAQLPPHLRYRKKPPAPPQAPPQASLQQQSVQPNVKEPAAQPQVLPHLRHVPSHLRNLPAHLRRVQPNVKEPPAQHQGQRQGQYQVQPQGQRKAQPYVPPHLRRVQHNVTPSALDENLANISLKRATQIFTTKVASDISPKSVKSGRVSKKPQKTKKAGRKASPRKHDAITEYVEKALPDMPVAIRNLWTGSKHLEFQLKKDGFPWVCFYELKPSVGTWVA